MSDPSLKRMRNDQIKFSSREEESLVEYSTISILAIIGLLLGVASALAMVGPVLWIVPPLAVVVSTIAWRRIADSPGLTGRNVAMMGIALAIFFGTAAPARMVSRKTILYRHARPIATAWFQLLAKKDLQAAHQWTLSQSQRQNPDLPLAQFYDGDHHADEARDNFFKRPHISKVAEMAPTSRLEFVKNHDQFGDDRGEYIVQLFRLRDERDGQERTLETLLVLQRSVRKTTGEISWQVTNLKDPNDTASQ